MVESATPTVVRSRNRESGGPMTLTETRAAGSPTVTPSRMVEAGGDLVGDDARPRVMVVFEDQYRSYREAIARALKSRRPHAKVSVAGLDALEAEIEGVAPDLVICSHPKARAARSALVWVEVPCDPTRPTAVCLEGRCSETPNLTLDELLSIVDAAEAIAIAQTVTGDGPP
jgi:hypothetical protein